MARIARFYNATITTTTTQIVPYNAKRTTLLIKNQSGQTIFVSTDQTEITTRGYPLAVGEFMAAVKVDGDVPELQMYAATSVGTSDVRIVETYEE